jgi:hypothetical protein
LQVERGIRYKEMGATFDAQLADAKRQKSEASDREAKRLAFYIFWNVKRDFDRCGAEAALELPMCTSTALAEGWLQAGRPHWRA